MPQFTEIERSVGLQDTSRYAPSCPQPVVVGYDGSEAARRAIAHAAAAAGEGGRVVVITACPPSHWQHAATMADATPCDCASLLDEAARVLDEQGVRVLPRAVEGDPAGALIEAAREVGAALIVVGARGRSFLERALRGSVAERLVSRAPCDVLVVR